MVQHLLSVGEKCRAGEGPCAFVTGGSSQHMVLKQRQIPRSTAQQPGGTRGTAASARQRTDPPLCAQWELLSNGSPREAGREISGIAWMFGSGGGVRGWAGL